MTNVVRLVAILLTLTAVVVGLPSSHAQQTAKLPVLGRLAASFPIKSLDAAFSQGLREFGYVDGHNIALVYRYAEGKNDRLAELAAELVRMKVDVIVAGSDAATFAAYQATTTIPIVMIRGGGIFARGLIDGLARPGGNVTGVTSYYPEVRGKALEIFKETFPKLRRVAVVRNPANPGHDINLKEIEKTARAVDVRVQTVDVERSDDLEHAFAAIIKGQAGGLFMLSSTVIRTQATRINHFAVARRIPTIYAEALHVENGGLMSYGVDFPELYRRAAFYVDRILKGAKPADLPVERSTKFELVINLQTAKKIGVTIPPAVLMDADRVIR